MSCVMFGFFPKYGGWPMTVIETSSCFFHPDAETEEMDWSNAFDGDDFEESSSSYENEDFEIIIDDETEEGGEDFEEETEDFLLETRKIA